MAFGFFMCTYLTVRRQSLMVAATRKLSHTVL